MKFSVPLFVLHVLSIASFTILLQYEHGGEAHKLYGSSFVTLHPVTFRFLDPNILLSTSFSNTIGVLRLERQAMFQTHTKQG
jgi:hypothetical protein